MRTILECGKEYNNWTVIKFDCVDRQRSVRYFCRCKCGHEASIRASAIVAGKTKQCIHCRASKLKGQQIDDWLVLYEAGVDKHRKQLWMCRCKCGNESVVVASNLTRHKSHCCFDCGHKMKMRSKIIPTSWWYKTIRQAQSRGWEWSLTEDEVYGLLEKQQFKCALTSLPLSFKPQTASLDRIDNKSHYSLENVQWVHKHINMMKHIYSNDYFIEMCRLVTENSDLTKLGPN